ncbi:MAG: rRNA maturation RNase YbeY, partial [Nitrospirota bacterium]|nr:rRNA maturation RNase YbeY [Nitrospirota bacterium]
LNRDYRGKDKTTDVLSFSMHEGEAIPGEETLLGDVVISLPVAERQAAEKGHSLEQEVTILLIHGILHLLGYDHERGEEEARKMEGLERQLLKKVQRSTFKGQG